MIRNLFFIIFLFFSFVSTSEVFAKDYSMNIYNEDDEDIEDVEELLQKAKESLEDNSFSKAKRLVEEAKKFGILKEEINKTLKYILEEERRNSVFISTRNFRGFSKNKCYKFSSPAVQKVCLEGIKTNACYSLKNIALQKVCLNGEKTNSCYSFNSIAKQKVCMDGVRTNACYSFSNSSVQNSCKKFRGSTEFWLILNSYGYYTY